MALPVSGFFVTNRIRRGLTGRYRVNDTSQDQNAREKGISNPRAATHCISGLIYQVLRPGEGNTRPGPDDELQVVYTARTETGSLFDTSGDSDTPKTLSVRGAMPGLAEALQLMTVGQEMRVWIPPELSSDTLKEARQGTLIFDITLVGFARRKEYPSLPVELTSPRNDE